MKRVLVTGACGSIGKELAKRLLDDGEKVCVFDNNEDGLFNLKNEFSQFSKNLRVFLGDIRDETRLTQAFEGVEEVYHCAALKHVELNEYNPFEALQTNVIGTNNVVSAAIRNNVKKVLITSSDKAVNPSSLMGTTKLLAEKLAISANNHTGKNDVNIGCVRFGNVWNTNGSVGRIFRKQILNNKDITVTDKNMSRFFITINDAVDLCIDSCRSLIGGEIFISDMGAATIGHLANEFSKHNKNIKVVATGLKAGEKLYEELFTDVESSRTYVYENMYVIIPDSLDPNNSRIDKLNKKYKTDKPVGEALRSDSEIAKKIVMSDMVKDIINAS